MYRREETEYLGAKRKAARLVCRGSVKPRDLPSNREIRDLVARFASVFEGDERTKNLQDMRVEALRMMRLLAAFRPRLIGSVLTGHVRHGSDIDIHVFTDSIESLCDALDDAGADYIVERKRVRKAGVEQTFTHVHIRDRFPVELTVYGSKMAHHVFKSSITGRAIERASTRELEIFLEQEYPNLSLDEAVIEAESRIDRFHAYELMLLPLEMVRQSPKYHPEGDALYHSLQVYDHMRDEAPYDEELLLAALLHDVGKAETMAEEHADIGADMLEGLITPRTDWLIRNHMQGCQLLDGELGARRRRRLEESEYFDDLMLLAECDKAGRQPGVEAPELDDALEEIREISEMY